MDLVHSRLIPAERLVAQSMVVALSSPEWAERSLEDFQKWIANPLLLGQGFIGFDGVHPVGVATWAMIPEDGVEHAIRGSNWLLEDWNSGPLCWAMDMVATEGHGKEFARGLVREMKARKMPVFWWRSKHARTGRLIPREAMV